jgi:hypothetical protein
MTHPHHGDAPSWAFMQNDNIRDSEYYTKGKQVFLAQLPKPSVIQRTCAGRIAEYKGIPTVETDSSVTIAFFTNVFDTREEAEAAWAQWHELRITYEQKT